MRLPAVKQNKYDGAVMIPRTAHYPNPRHDWHGPGLGLLLGLSLACFSEAARPAGNKSVRETVSELALRLGKAHSASEIKAFTMARMLGELTPDERFVLAERHIAFRVNVPVVVTILRDLSVEEPFWLKERGFRPVGSTFTVGEHRFEAWERQFPAGPVGLGVNSLSGGGEHYLVLARPQAQGRPLRIDKLSPPQSRVAKFVPGTQPYADRDDTINEIPDAWRGLTLVQTLRQNRDDAKLIGGWRQTEHPSSPRPDHIVLTWNGDPRTTQAIQWRTGPATKVGWLAFGKRADSGASRPRRLEHVRASTQRLIDARLLNDPIVHWHTVELKGLEPGTHYVYCVGDGSTGGWSELAEFVTAPARPAPFAFVYMGDAQKGLKQWGELTQTAFRVRPEAAFCLVAGDIVDRGNERNEWDSLFSNAASVFNRRPLVPVLGNHDCQGSHPTFYLRQFALPRNGPPGMEPERAYSFQYGNALLVILDSNTDPARQSAWLEKQLAKSQSKWKFVAYHHPAYSSAPNRDNAKLRQQWTPLFDRYRVDLALQGHDHAYLRTYPLKASKAGANPNDGTRYVVSVSGTKMYRQSERPYTKVGFTNVPTFQLLDIQVGGDQLNYRAYDADGRVRDELVIRK